MIRSTYRALLRSNRSYAAFTAADRLLIRRLSDCDAVLDPMSGYGSLTHLAVAQSQSCFCLELNEPQFLWQVLTHPSSRQTILAAAAHLRISIRKGRQPACAIISDSFFPEDAKQIVRDLRTRVQRAVEHAGAGLDTADMVDALMLPFVGRLACVRPSFNPAHVKRGGGICVLRDWQQDFRDYLDALIALLGRLPVPPASCPLLGLAHGDARSYEFESRLYDGMKRAG